MPSSPSVSSLRGSTNASWIAMFFSTGVAQARIFTFKELPEGSRRKVVLVERFRLSASGGDQSGRSTVGTLVATWWSSFPSGWISHTPS